MTPTRASLLLMLLLHTEANANFICDLLFRRNPQSDSAEKITRQETVVHLSDSELLELNHFRAVRIAPSFLRKMGGEEEIPAEIVFRNENYRVIEFLGGGEQGSVFLTKDKVGNLFAIKQNHPHPTLKPHEDLLRAHEAGIPTIIDSQTLYDRRSSTARYRYHRGLSVAEIVKNDELALETRNKIEDAYQRWKRIFCAGKSKSTCTPKNVLFDFETRTFLLLDAY